MSQIEPTYVAHIVSALLSRADQLGLTWRLRPATIDTPSVSGSSMAILDGDAVPIQVIPLIGSVTIGDRVMVAAVPPSGHYVIGWAGSPPWETLDSLAITTVGLYYNATAEALVTSASVSGSLIAGRRYRIMVGCPIKCATVGHVARLRIRVTNLAGALLAVKQHTIPGVNYDETVFFWGDYIPTVSGLTAFVLTCERVAGATSNIQVSVLTGYPVTMSLATLAEPSSIRTV